MASTTARVKTFVVMLVNVDTGGAVAQDVLRLFSLSLGELGSSFGHDLILYLWPVHSWMTGRMFVSLSIR